MKTSTLIRIVELLHYVVRRDLEDELDVIIRELREEISKRKKEKK